MELHPIAAFAEFQDLYRQNPEWEGGHSCLARAHMAKRNYGAAIDELRAAIRQNPAGAAEHRVLGQALLLAGKDQEALHELQVAVSINPDSALAHHYLGTALVNTQQLAEAEKEFIKDVKKHIDAISRKYIIPAEGTMDFALMYLPSESVYYEVVNQLDVLEYARNLRVYMVSPSTLYAHLQTILLSFEGKRIESKLSRFKY